MSFKTGARPPKDARALAFADFRRDRSDLSAYPAVDYLAAFPGWQVLGNDTASDCVAVWWANSRRLTSATLTTESYPGQEQVWALYETQNPLFDPDDPTSFGGPSDEGMEVQTLLEHLVKQGGPDGVKALGFAKVDHEDPDEIRAAISTAGSVLLVVTVTQAQQEQFDTGRPWDFDEKAPTEGQHAILVGGHAESGPDGDAHLDFITWGRETALTEAFFDNAVVGAWLVIWPEHLGNRQFLDGMDLEAFAAAYTGITGRPFPLPPQPEHEPEQLAPAPEPAPAPVPPVAPPVSPDAAGDALAVALRAWLAGSPGDWDGIFPLQRHGAAWLRARYPEGAQMEENQGSQFTTPGTDAQRAGTDVPRTDIESTPVDPHRAHVDDQQAQLDNEREYPPSTDARTRQILEDRAERAGVVAGVQDEALADQREREGLAEQTREHQVAEDEGRITVPDAQVDPAYPAPGGDDGERTEQAPPSVD